MIYRLLGWFRHFAAAEYWRMRAIRAEERLEAEVWRNREREDTLITVPMRAQGMFGMQPRSGPASLAQPQLPAPLRSADPFDGLSPLEKMEFETQWKPDAEANGVPLPRAKQEFVQRKLHQRTLNDDGFQM